MGNLEKRAERWQAEEAGMVCVLSRGALADYMYGFVFRSGGSTAG
jgi:hypothetical protein